MMNLNVTDEKNLAELLKTLLKGSQYKLVLTKDNEPVASITFEEKPNVKEMTDAEKIQEWARLEKIKKDDEIVTTDENGNPAIIKESELDDLIKTQKSRKSGFGILKDKYKFPPDFDEKFVAMDAEILADFGNDSDYEFMEAAK
mgnify:FL=1